MTIHPQSGLTLLEVIVAVFLLSLALLGLAAVFPPANLAVVQGGIATRATALAEERLEVARHTAYAALPSLAGTDSTTNPPYTVTTAVAANAPSANLTTVTVTVTGPAIAGPNVQPMGPAIVQVQTFFSAS
jgi:prepilin-type N-terminal cleavage/methylation domain-containing protein